MKNLTKTNTNTELVIITEGRNDYPTGLKSGIVGFDSFKDLENFANRYGMTPVYLKRRDGHHFYINEGAAYKPYTADDYIETQHPNAYPTDFESIKNIFKNELENLEGEEFFDKLSELTDNYSEIIEELKCAGENEVVMIYSSDYIETINLNDYELGYSHDVYNYTIGINLENINEQSIIDNVILPFFSNSDITAELSTLTGHSYKYDEIMASLNESQQDWEDLPCDAEGANQEQEEEQDEFLESLANEIKTFLIKA